MKHFKKTVAVFCAVMALAASCNKETEIPVSSITLDTTELEMTIGDTHQLSVTTEPVDATCQEFVFMSNNNSVATVTEEGLVTAVSEGTATITVSSAKSSAYQNCKIVVKTPGKNLSEVETSNCYIVSEPGIYKFKPTKGNSSQVVVPASVELLWETLGTETAPEAGTLLKDVKYDAGLIYFTVPDPFMQGNAVIAAKNESGVIIWSWHIWLVSEINEIVYANNAGVMMDRNLGAISAEPGNVGALGLIYQWGRKDPFPGAAAIKASNTFAASTPAAPDRIVMTAETGTIEYTTANPRVFLSYDKTKSGAAQDWLYNDADAGATDATRWGTDKTMYDPCPIGWKVPRATSAGIWKVAGIPHNEATPNADAEKCGITLADPYCTPATWYPAAGQTTNGKVTSGNDGYYWSCSTTDAGGKKFTAGLFKFLMTGKIYSADNGPKYYGRAVRCQKVVAAE